MDKLFANSGDPDQTPRSAASDLGMHCLPNTLLRVSRLQWVNVMKGNRWRNRRNNAILLVPSAAWTADLTHL